MMISLSLRAAERLISRTIEKSGIRTVERITELHGEKGKIRKNVRGVSTINS
jgi:hypothetical protein